jgi:vanillate O-demethylase ferredoxin subunit
MTVLVRGKRAEATGVVALELVDPSGNALPPFSAGSHIDVEVRPGLVRQYSLCNDPVERHRYVIAVLKESTSRGGSIFLHDSVRDGDTIRISAPRNHFPLHGDATRTVLFAGGIGITPLLCMCERLAGSGKGFDLHYCVRSLDRAAFRDRLTAGTLGGQVHIHLDDGDEAQKLDVTASLGAYTPGAHAYVCGPGGFMAWVLESARKAGWPEDALHREYFAAPATTEEKPSGSFQVRLASSGQVLDIPPERSVMQVLADAGVELPSSCEQGTCGSCLTRVLEGTPDHRDVYLTDDEKAANDQFTPCVSRSLTPLLVLDV